MAFTIFYTNFGYGPDEEYATIELAIAASKKVCFETQIYCGETRESRELVATWSPLYGLKKRYGVVLCTSIL